MDGPVEPVSKKRYLFTTRISDEPATGGVTDKPRPPPLSRERLIGIGTGRKNPGKLLGYCIGSPLVERDSLLACWDLQIP